MDNLHQRFDAVPASCLIQHARPTDGSISRINAHFGIVLPSQLIQLAEQSKNYAAYFLSLGTDYESPAHIIRVNSYWRRRRPKRRIPNNLLILTQGSMDDAFWCLDTEAYGGGDDGYAVQFWCPEAIAYASDDRPILRYANFAQYMEGVIRWR